MWPRGAADEKLGPRRARGCYCTSRLFTWGPGGGRVGGAELQERRCLGGRGLQQELRTNPQGESKGMEEQLLGQNMSECTVGGDIIIRAGINPGREWREETFWNVSWPLSQEPLSLALVPSLWFALWTGKARLHGLTCMVTDCEETSGKPEESSGERTHSSAGLRCLRSRTCVTY